MFFKSIALAMSMLTATGSLVVAETYEIDQIMDMAALTPEDFYRFVPNYHWIEVGDSVRFNNTTGNHTVKSVEGIWPEGVAPIFIKNQDVTDIHLTVPGVYGFRCTVHSRHGMFALVIVGSPDSNIDQISLTKMNDRGEKVFKGLLERMEKERLNR